MSKSSFLLGVILGGAAATAAAIKLTDTTPQQLKDAVVEKFDEFMEANDFDADAFKNRAASSVDDLKQRGLDLANRANSKFNSDMGDEDEDFVVDNMVETPYEKPTEVFMPHEIKE